MERYGTIRGCSLEVEGITVLSGPQQADQLPSSLVDLLEDSNIARVIIEYQDKRFLAVNKIVQVTKE